MPKTSEKAGHAYRLPVGQYSWESSCECGHIFNARTAARRRALWRDHLRDLERNEKSVNTARKLIKDRAMLLRAAKFAVFFIENQHDKNEEPTFTANLRAAIAAAEGNP